MIKKIKKYKNIIILLNFIYIYFINNLHLSKLQK